MKSFLALASLAYLAFAKTNGDGCTAFTSTVAIHPKAGFGDNVGAVIYHASNSFEVRQGVDCAGGSVPLRDVPGCPRCSGPETVTASVLPLDPAASTESLRVAGRFVQRRASFTGEQESGSAASNNFLQPPGTNDSGETPVNPTQYDPQNRGDDEETLAKTLAVTASSSSTSFTHGLSITRAHISGNTTTTSIAADRSVTILPPNVPKPGTKPTAMALAINLMTGLAALMAML